MSFAPGDIRAVVTDVDGTILHTDGTLGEATTSAFAELAASGIPVLIATGRTPSGLHVLGALLEHVSVAVCCSGSVGFDPATGALLWRHRLAPQVVEHVVGCLAQSVPDAGIGVYNGQGWTLTDTYFPARGAWPAGPYRVVPQARLADVDGCSLAISHAVLTSAQIAERLAEAGVRSDEATVTYAGTRILDVVAPDVDKGVGVTRALARLGVEPAQAIGFGDAANDLAMFGVVGLPVAVANAHPAVLAAARMVAPANDEDGVARLLAELGLTRRAGSPGPAASAR